MHLLWHNPYPYDLDNNYCPAQPTGITLRSELRHSLRGSPRLCRWIEHFTQLARSVRLGFDLDGGSSKGPDMSRNE